MKIEFDHAIDDLSVLDFPMIFGADGSGSVVRRRLAANPDFTNVESHLDHGYKELSIPAGPEARTDWNATHFTFGRAARIC